MECPQCGKSLEKGHRFCSECGQRVRGIFGLLPQQKAWIFAVVVAADVIAFLFTEGVLLAVTLPLTFILLFLFMARPRWAQTLPSDKWI